MNSFSPPKPLSGKKLVIIGSGLAGCSVAELSKNFFDEIVLIDDFSPQRTNAFLTNAGSLHHGYGTTGHAHSAMLSTHSPLWDTIRKSVQHHRICSLWFTPTIGKSFRAISTLYGLYNKEVPKIVQKYSIDCINVHLKF